MRFVLLLLCHILSNNLFSQNSIVGSKPAYDTSMIGTWPYLGNNRPVISGDAKTVAFFVNNKPKGKNTLVIQDIQDRQKVEFVISGSCNDYFFTKDNKAFYWKYSDTLFRYNLVAKNLNTEPDIYTIKYPENNKGEWIAIQMKSSPTDLVLRNLLTNKEFVYSEIKEAAFNTIGTGLVLVCKNNVSNISTLKWVDVLRGNSKLVWSSKKDHIIGKYLFDPIGDKLVFNVIDTKKNELCKEIYYYKQGMDSAILKVNETARSFIDFGTRYNGSLTFSANSKWVFFETEKKNTLKPDANISKVEIWSYKDEVINPAQQYYSQTTRGVIGVNADTDIKLNNENEGVVAGASPGFITGDFIVVRDNYSSPGPWWPHSPKPVCWLVSLVNGERILLKREKKWPISNLSFSPTGRYVIYWDRDENSYMCFDTKNRKTENLTIKIPAKVTNEYVNTFFSEPVDDIAGWYAEDSLLLLYDRYDIWKVDPNGVKLPVNITNSFGRKNKIKLRLIYPMDSKSKILTGKETILLTGFNVDNKYNGFLIKELANNSNPKVLTMGPYTYYRVLSQKGHGYAFDNGMLPIQGGTENNIIWIVKRGSAVEFPNYYSTSDFKHFSALTDFEPQKDCNWLRTELISFKQMDGTVSQGVLYKPENFDSSKKYPLIFNYYEKLSHRLYEFPWPGLSDANINVAWFVSRGYLVFTPDIQFSVAAEKNGKTTGEAAFNSILGAAHHLALLPYVDKKKMALQGHSFGGGLTNYIITHSDLFAAASEMAGTSDQVSSYLTLVSLTSEVEYMHKQDQPLARFGATPWERPDLFVKRSDVLRADKISTPLLIVHNKKDGAINWQQGLEMYMALRRLGKKCWMLQYDESAHVLNGKDALDYTIRLTQFFDFYLKNKVPPVWMTNTVAAKYKGMSAMYELDQTGALP